MLCKLITTYLSVAKCQYYPRYRKITLTVANLFTYLLYRKSKTTELTKKLFWISMPLGTKVGLGPGDIIVLDGDPAPHGKAPFPQIDIIGAMVIVWRVSYSM